MKKLKYLSKNVTEKQNVLLMENVIQFAKLNSRIEKQNGKQNSK